MLSLIDIAFCILRQEFYVYPIIHIVVVNVGYSLSYTFDLEFRKYRTFVGSDRIQRTIYNVGDCMHRLVKTFNLITRIDLYLAQVHSNAHFYFLYPTTILPWSNSLVCVFHHL